MLTTSLNTFFQGVQDYYPPASSSNLPSPSAPYAGRQPAAPSLSLGLPFGQDSRTSNVNVYHDTSSMAERRQFNREDQEEARQNSAATAGGCSLILIALVGGWVFTNLQKEAAELKRATDYLQKKDYSELPSPELQETGRKLASAHRDRVELSYNRARNCTILTGMLFVSAAAGFAGGMLAVPSLITGAIVGAVTTATIGAFYASYNFFNPIDQTPSTPFEVRALQTLIRHEANEQDRVLAATESVSENEWAG